MNRTLLISDKYAGKPFAPITIPPGAGFIDMVALKGKPDIGDQINKTIIAPLEAANRIRLKADFNDSSLLGQGKEMVERLGNLIAIFKNPALDFSRNRADGDDLLGDAYEYLMRHFATESGKSKGQFYTPAEVSRVLARIIGIASAATTPETTVYDPTCGSGSLLLKVAEAARVPPTLYGQEKDEATAGLAQMNRVLHNQPGALIEQGNTLADPKFFDGDTLKTFDYVVANPPFSDKRWSTGFDPLNDRHGRFDPYGVPPAKQGDYAYLLHIVRSLKSTGTAACILPHGVLFRGNAEADIRRNLVRRGLVKGLIGLPANLFYGTGIPACIVVIDKREAAARRGIFMLDASRGFLKDGPKNRLREQDIHRIVDAFTRFDASDPRYARLVPLAEIEKNDFNLNLPRYIDGAQAEDKQDIEAHLHGGIPAADIAALQPYWAVCPKVQAALLRHGRAGYLDLAVDASTIQRTIHQHPEFAAFIARLNAHFGLWRERMKQRLRGLQIGLHPKALIEEIAEDLLAHYQGQPLVDAYGIYQQLMDYWAQTMQDDAYLIAADGWQAETYRVIETKKAKDGKAGKQIDKGWASDLLPKQTIVARFFAAEQAALDTLAARLEATSAMLAELEEEHSGGGDDGEGGVFTGFDKINAASVKERIKEIGRDASAADELAVLKQWQQLAADEAALKRQLKDADAALDALAYARYPLLTGDDVKAMVVDDKWMAALGIAIHTEVDRVSRALTQRVKELADRYGTPLPRLVENVDALELKVRGHLEAMGFAWR